MPDLKAGRAFFELFLDDKALTRGLTATQKTLSSWASGLRSVGQTLGAVSAVGAVAFAPAIAAASNATEVMSKFDTVFGDQAPAMKAWGDALAQQIGRAKTEVAGFAAGSQDLFVPIGFDEANATKLTKVVTQLAFDLASFNNQLDADAIRDIQAALTGSGEVMKKYGVIVSEATVKQQLLNQGFSKEQANGASEQEKVLARLAIILKGTTAAQGDAARTAGSFANQMKALKGAGQDALEAIGAPLTQALIPYVETMKSGIVAVAQFAQANSGIASTAVAVAVGVAAAAAGAIGLSIAFGAVASVIGTVMSIGTGIAALFGTIGAVVGAVASPLGIVIALFAGVAAVMIDWQQVGAAVVDFVSSKFESLSEIVGGTFKAIKDAMASGDMLGAANVLWAGLKLAWLEGTKEIRKAWGDAVTFIQSVWIYVFDNVQQKLLGFNNTIAQGISTLASGLYEIAGNIAGFLGFKDVSEQFKRDAEVWAQSVDTLQGDREAGLKQIQAQTEAKIAALYGSSDADLKKAQAELERARQEWKAAVDQTAQSKSDSEAVKAAGASAPTKLNLDGITAGISAAGKEMDKAISAKGTFSADASRVLGGVDSVPKTQLAEAKKQTQLLEKIAAAADEGGLVFAN